MKPLSIMSAIAFCLVAAVASAEDVKLGPLEISHPWARATPKGASVGGGYVTVRNAGTSPDRLVGGTLAGAGRVEIHEMSMDGGVMRMREVNGGLQIAPGETVALQPGAFHLMFMGLTSPLEKGKPVKGTLVFEHAGTVEVTYDVEPIGAKPGARDEHMNMK
jgi:copper(I)-binding protein